MRDAIQRVVMRGRETVAQAVDAFVTTVIVPRTTIDIHDRQPIEAFVTRIEMNPGTKTGVVWRHTEMADTFQANTSRHPIGDDMEGTGPVLLRWPAGPPA